MSGHGEGGRGEIRAVVFDLGGVVVKICRSWKEACVAAGEPFHEIAMSPEVMAARKALVRRFEVNAMGEAEFFAAVAGTTGGLYTAEQFRRIHEAWILAEYPGVAGLIDELHRAGVVTGVLSNTNACHWRQLAPHAEIAGHEPRFFTPAKVKHLHASHLLKLAKPEREIYDEFARLVSLSPASLLFFDDLEENVHGARGAGWKAERVDHTGDTAAQMRGHLRAYGVL
jgi:HAD superfamily hydrolase (TIGR01509 family)